ncbi:DUF4158 domain-containing protein, partial [Nonomuraea sp. RK-328]|nr:DUF4158 domain-containing protein [Nonomuraea sp. RK-328]
MPFEFLSDEQVARYGRFPAEPSPAELEQFFRLDRSALDALASKRRSATKLGWAVQWGTVRMLGVFLTEDPLAVPPGAAGLPRLRCRRERGAPVRGGASVGVGGGAAGAV